MFVEVSKSLLGKDGTEAKKVMFPARPPAGHLASIHSYHVEGIIDKDNPRKSFSYFLSRQSYTVCARTTATSRNRRLLHGFYIPKLPLLEDEVKYIDLKYRSRVSLIGSCSSHLRPQYY